MLNDFNWYQKEAAKTDLTKPDIRPHYYALGIASEAGEIAGKIKKAILSGKPLTKEQKKQAASELGDELWYITRMAEYLGYDLHQIATMNIEKLATRKKEGTLIGDGDNR